jgi:D-lactate dehydrogenase
MKIAFYEIEEWEIPFLQKQLSGYDLVFDKEQLHEEEAKGLADVSILSIFIYSPLTAEVLSHMPKLKLIVTRSMGFDHIDLEYCKKNGITVCNIANYGGNTVAEHAFALLLALSRKLVPSIDRTRRGNFELQGLRGFDLFGKTIGVIGMGHIGSNVIRIAQGFGMKVVVFSRHPSEEEAKRLKITYMGLRELFQASDIVSLHVPYTKETHHMINKKTLKWFKKGALLINTARGGLIETEALVLGLEQGILGGIGLDVLEEECGVKEERQLLTGNFLQQCDLKTQLYNHVLLNKENVIITPHNAFNSQEALHTIITTTADNIAKYLQGAPQNIVVAH